MHTSVGAPLIPNKLSLLKLKRPVKQCHTQRRGVSLGNVRVSIGANSCHCCYNDKNAIDLTEADLQCWRGTGGRRGEAAERCRRAGRQSAPPAGRTWTRI